MTSIKLLIAYSSTERRHLYDEIYYKLQRCLAQPLP